MLAAILGGLFLVYKLLIYRKPENKADEPATTQELFGKEAVVGDDGIIEVQNTFRVCMQLSQVNMRTNADIEKFKVWAAFRSFLNEVGLPYTLLQLSQFVDVRDYARWYQERMEKARLTQELRDSGKAVVGFIESMDEDRNSRDYSGYIIFHYDPDVDSINFGVATGNPKIDEFVSKLTGKKNMSKAEKKNLARMMLTEAVHVVINYAEQMGVQCKQLNKAQVYDLTYKIIQKDLAAFSSIEEASEAQCFTAFHDSLTARVLARELREGERDAV